MSQGSDKRRDRSYTTAQSRKSSYFLSRPNDDMLRCINELLRHQDELEKQISTLNSSLDDMSGLLERYSRLYEFTPHGYFSLDRQGIISQANLSAAAMLGMDREILSGMDFCQFTCKKFRKRCREFIQDAFASGRKISRDLRFQGPGTLPFWGSAAACASPDGRECMVTVTDITKRKQAEENLEHSRRQAEESSQAKTDYLAVMSHEIRTPLSGVVMILESLKDTALSQEQQKLVSLAEKSSGRLQRLLSDILDLSRVEAGKLEIINAPFSIRDLPEAVLDLFRPQAVKKGLELNCGLDSQLPGVLIGDESRIRQVIFNLVSNAVKYTQTGGITLRISLEDIRSSRARVCFSIKDSGQGMTSEDISRAVKPFVRLEHSAGSRQEGTGLGLNIVSRLVELMNGEFDIKSRPGQGTEARFILNLEVASEAHQGSVPGEKNAEENMAVSPLKILYAEDDEVHAMIMKDILEDWGHTVHLAPDGQAAMQLLAENNYDCVLMDIRMPVMDGIETTYAIRKAAIPGIRRDIPIIALTACAMKGDREKILEAGMDAYLSKPAGVKDIDLILKTSIALLEDRQEKDGSCAGQ